MNYSLWFVPTNTVHHPMNHYPVVIFSLYEKACLIIMKNAKYSDNFHHESFANVVVLFTVCDWWWGDIHLRYPFLPALHLPFSSHRLLCKYFSQLYTHQLHLSFRLVHTLCCRDCCSFVYLTSSRTILQLQIFGVELLPHAMLSF